MGKYEESLEYFNKALHIFEKESAESINCAYVFQGKGNIFKAQGKFSESL